MNYSDFRFNLPNVEVHNTCYISVSSVGGLFSNVFGFNEMECNK